MKNCILGFGEIGKALFSLYKEKKIDVIKKDINDNFYFNNIDVLNVCIPYSNKFINIINDEIKKCNAKLTIIHSTVPIGTTKKIKIPLNSHIVNSPIVGSHPFLKKSLKTFIKFIGSNDKKAIQLAKKHYKKLDIKSKSFNTFETTETAKLLCTSYYGLCIAWHDYINDVCKINNIDSSVVKKWNKNYNYGYNKLNLSMFTRPILNPPKNKKIGGHCIIPNAELLNNFLPNEMIKHILKFK
jgi:UDP-N-acetyl-D-mannosaminuronate dehydrogenase